MQPQIAAPRSVASNSYLFGRGPAWFAYLMTIALMMFDYIDRQIIASMFPFLKSDWMLTDAQLGALVSVVSVTVAVFGIPVAWIADRFSRVKSIVAMATTWSIATIACMFAQGYIHLLVARAFVGLGEAGYGSVGAAMVATHFPLRMRSGILGGFFASASVGSVLGVVLGGVIAQRFGWKAGFGVVGIPGVILALLYLFVRDYKTVEVAGAAGPSAFGAAATASRGRMIRSILRSRTVRWVCIGGAAQLIALSALWSWLPSYLNRIQHLSPDMAAVQAALVVLAGAVGSVVLGAVADRAGLRRPAGRFVTVALLSVLTAVLPACLWRQALRPGNVAQQPVRPDCARRLCCDMHRRTRRGDRDWSHPSRRPIDRGIGAVAFPEPVWIGRGTVHRRHAVGCGRIGNGDDPDADRLRRRGAVVPRRAAHLCGRICRIDVRFFGVLGGKPRINDAFLAVAN
jgi:MFS family permease